MGQGEKCALDKLSNGWPKSLDFTLLVMGSLRVFLGEGVTWPDPCCSRSGRGARGTSLEVGWPKEAGAGTPREIRPKFMNVPDPRSQGSNAC